MFGDLIKPIQAAVMKLIPKIQTHAKRIARFQVAGAILAELCVQKPEIGTDLKLRDVVNKKAIELARALEKAIDADDPEIETD